MEANTRAPITPTMATNTTLFIFCAYHLPPAAKMDKKGCRTFHQNTATASLSGFQLQGLIPRQNLILVNQEGSAPARRQSGVGTISVCSFDAQFHKGGGAVDGKGQAVSEVHRSTRLQHLRCRDKRRGIRQSARGKHSAPIVPPLVIAPHQIDAGITLFGAQLARAGQKALV